jgi:hypothetical protein
MLAPRRFRYFSFSNTRKYENNRLDRSGLPARLRANVRTLASRSPDANATGHVL